MNNQRGGVGREDDQEEEVFQRYRMVLIRSQMGACIAMESMLSQGAEL